MKFPTIEEMAKNVAEKALDEVEYNGKTLREWMEIIIETASDDTISRRAAVEAIPKKQNGTGGESWMKTYRRSGHNDCVNACVTALQELPPVTYTKINPPSDYARQFGLIPKEDATDNNVATKDAISRRKLQEKFEQWQKTDGYSNGEWNLLVDVLDVIKSMPPASQHGTNLAEVGTDCISRQQAIDAVQNRHMMLSKEKVLLINDLEKLPPAQPKMGRWIYCEDSMANSVDGYRCDQCGFFVPWDYTHKGIDFIQDYNFCPSCGTKMRMTT